MESNGLCMTHNDLCVYSPEFENKSENRKKKKYMTKLVDIKNPY